MTISRIYNPAAITAISSGTSVSVTMPAGIADGDLIVIAYFVRSAVSVPAGFTDHGNYAVANVGQRVGIATKIAVAADISTVKTFTTVSSGRAGLFPAVYRGSGGVLEVGQFTGLDYTNVVGNATITCPTITESVDYTAFSACTNAFVVSGSTLPTPLIEASSDPDWEKLNTTAVSGVSRLSAADCIITAGASPLLVWEKGGAIDADMAVAVLSITESGGGGATAEGAPASSSAAPASGGSTGGASAPGASASLTVSPASGSASSASGANASGSMASASVSAVSGPASGEASASGAATSASVSAATGSASSGASLILVTNIDGGNMSSTLSSVTDAASASPIVYVDVREIGVGVGWRHAIFAVEDAAGKTPIFRINWATKLNTSTPGAEIKPLYTTDTTDPTSWVRAPSRTLVGGTTGYLEWQFTDPLPSGRVYVSVWPMGRYSDAVALAEELLALPIASPAPSADVNGVYNVTPAQVDSYANDVGELNQYAIRLQWPTATTDGGPKREHVELAQIHAAGESSSWVHFWYGVQWMLNSASSEAAAFRANFNVTLYFAVTANGLKGGHYRWNLDRNVDPNRAFDDPATLAEILALTNAVIADTTAYGRKDSFYSWHGNSTTATLYMYYAVPGLTTAQAAAVDAMKASILAQTGLTPTLYSATEVVGTDAWWAAAQGFTLPVSLEMQQNGTTALSSYQAGGENWRQAIIDADADGVFWTAGADGVASGAVTGASCYATTGTGQGEAVAGGATVSAYASAIDGASTGGAGGSGAVVSASVSALTGAATAGGSAIAAGSIAGASVATSTGAGAGSGAADGATADATVAPAGGSASSAIIAYGALVSASASATGGTSAGDGAAAGATVSAAVSAPAGAAIVPGSGFAMGSLSDAGASPSPGWASGAAVIMGGLSRCAIYPATGAGSASAGAAGSLYHVAVTAATFGESEMATIGYTNEAALTSYAAARGVTLTTSTVVLLTKALDYIELQPFAGERTEYAQANEWPRTGVYINGMQISSTEVPERIVKAQLEAAMAIDAGADLLGAIEPKVTNETVFGAVSISYSDSGSSTTIYPKLNALLAPYLAGGSGSANIRVSR